MTLVLSQISKRFDGHPVVQGIDLSVADGELFVLLGTSGSGKSTLLRLIAGLIRPDSGSISVNGTEVTGVPPQRRGMGFVFQNYALFRHLSVSENVQFGLRVRGVDPVERRRRCEDLLDLVGLGGLGHRLPTELSGGQRQRVALARALAYEPKLLLLDEPFGALDVRIRSQLRRSFHEIQRQLKILAVLVTHDQEEAFELSDRMGVIDRGRLVEVGTPTQLYHLPKTETVATFIGGGNVLVGRTERKFIRLGETLVPFPADAPKHEDGAPARILFRPETVRFKATEFVPNDRVLPIGHGRVIDHSFTGPAERIRFELTSLQGARPLWPALSYGQRYAVIEAVRQSAVESEFGVKIGEQYWIGLSSYHVLAPTGLRILVGIDRIASTAPPVAAISRLIQASHGFATLVHITPDQAQVDGGRKQIELLHAQLAKGMESHFEAKVRTGSIAHELEEEAQQGSFDLAILELARGEGERLKRMKLAARRLLWYGKCPVLLAYPGKELLRRILVCTAAGEPGKSDVRLGARLARHLGAEVTVLHVSRAEYSAADKARVERYLSQAREMFVALGVKAEVQITQGSPISTIASTALTGAYDLVIVGAPLRGEEDSGDLVTRLGETLEASLLVVPMEPE